jgi:hypothetical protein
MSRRQHFRSGFRIVGAAVATAQLHAILTFV